MIVKAGLMPVFVTWTEPSASTTLVQSCSVAVGSQTDVAGSVPIRQVPAWCWPADRRGCGFALGQDQNSAAPLASIHSRARVSEEARGQVVIGMRVTGQPGHRQAQVVGNGRSSSTRRRRLGVPGSGPIT